MHTYHFSHS